MGSLWEIVADYVPGKQKGFWAIPLFLLTLILVSLVSVLFIVLLLVAVPVSCIIQAIKHPEKVDDTLQFDKNLHAPKPVQPRKTPEEIAEENRIWHEKMMAARFTIDRNDLPYDPDEKEIIFYTPEPAQEVENAISSNYHEIKRVFEQRGYNFVFLPYFNKELNVLLNADKFNYYNPKSENLLKIPAETLTYQDIKEALKIPDKVDGPCFIRCKRKDKDPLIFTFFKILFQGDIMLCVQEYIGILGDGRMYSLSPYDAEVEEVVFDYKIKTDYTFDSEAYQIGEEIRERIERLRTKGLTTLAIRKLIGDEADKPGKLLIDRHNKLILTDFGNKEIKLEPLHKAVFFLFLRHPEGINFKDLGDYREELGNIYREITGRDDLAGIEDSINKLTDPMNNSINEKCARIKNAFVSEFREEVAQWYFIDGKRGEKKSIKIPRELVTWEIKD